MKRLAKRIIDIFKRSARFHKHKPIIKKYIGGGSFIFNNSKVYKTRIIDYFNGKFLFFGLCKFSKKQNKQTSQILIKSGESKIVYLINDLAICCYKYKNGINQTIQNPYLNKLPYPRVKLIKVYKNSIVYKRALGKNPSTCDEVKTICLSIMDCIIKNDDVLLNEGLAINHGNFSITNVFISEKNEFECIDFDNVGVYPLLNDVFSIILEPYIYHNDPRFIPILNDPEIIRKYNELRKKINYNHSFYEVFSNYYEFWKKNNQMGFYLFGQPYQTFFVKQISNFKEITDCFKN